MKKIILVTTMALICFSVIFFNDKKNDIPKEDNIPQINALLKVPSFPHAEENNAEVKKTPPIRNLEKIETLTNDLTREDVQDSNLDLDLDKVVQTKYVVIKKGNIDTDKKAVLVDRLKIPNGTNSIWYKLKIQFNEVAEYIFYLKYFKCENSQNEKVIEFLGFENACYLLSGYVHFEDEWADFTIHGNVKQLIWKERVPFLDYNLENTFIDVDELHVARIILPLPDKNKKTEKDKVQFLKKINKSIEWTEGQNADWNLTSEHEALDFGKQVAKRAID